MRSKRTFSFAAFASVLAAPALALALATGDAIPAADTKLENVDGRKLSISEVAGDKGKLVIFTCNHCPYVKAWEDRIAALGNEYSKKGIGVIAINSNDPSRNPEDGLEGMKERAEDKKLAFPYAVDADSSVAKAFGATKTPEVFLFDAGGKLVYHGAVDDNSGDATAVREHYLKNALESVVSGKPVEVAETKALGCGIKFRQ